MTTQQTESQSQLAENMKISESLLKGVISSAANLEAIVGEVHASLSLVPSMKERSFFFHAGIFAVLYIYLSKPNTPKILALVAFCACGSPEYSMVILTFQILPMG